MALPRSAPESAKQHYRRMFALQALTVAAVMRAWSRVDTDDLRVAWQREITQLEPMLTEAQVSAARAGSSYISTAVVESSGVWRAPKAFVDPRGFSGLTAQNIPWPAVLSLPVVTTLTSIKRGADIEDAMRSGQHQLKRIVTTELTDAARTAAGADIATRAGVGYIRLVNHPACRDCMILAGKFFRWNEGFLRHPNCQCVHVPATGQAVEAGEAEGYFTDPYKQFDSLSRDEQDRIFGAADAQAIRDGSDIYRVVNAEYGTSAAGDTTTSLSDQYGTGRLTPEGIYKQASNRAEAVEMLERYGYILPGGQVPGGSIRGPFYEGFGEFGRGGTRRGARDSVLEARRTGVRDPNNRYTMTAAERRLFDARLRYEAVLEGRNPYGTGPLTPDIAAQVETDFRRWLTTGGNIY